jgi:tetratricopeptide (TPR) repeat protein
VTLQPALAPAHGVLAKLQMQAGRYREAADQCRRALAIDPDDQAALYRLIQALRRSEYKADKAQILELLKRLAALRDKSAKDERERYRYSSWRLLAGRQTDEKSSWKNAKFLNRRPGTLICTNVLRYPSACWAAAMREMMPSTFASSAGSGCVASVQDEPSIHL